MGYFNAILDAVRKVGPASHNLDETAIMIVGDQLDYRTASDFKYRANFHMERGKRLFILDFSQTHSFDSTGIGAVFSLFRKLQRINGDIRFAAAPPVVQNAMRLTGSDNIFPQFSSVAAAIEGEEGVS